MKFRERDWFDMGGRHSLQNRIADLAQILPLAGDLSRMTAVDIGAAEGDISFWLSKQYLSVHSIESMAQAWEKLRERARQYPNVSVEHADIRRVSFESTYYDHVFFLGVLHYFMDDDKKQEILLKVLQSSHRMAFVRTGIREHKVKQGVSVNLQKYTPLSIFSLVAEKLCLDAVVIDNSARDDVTERLGDLVVYASKSSPEASMLCKIESLFPSAVRL